MSADTNDAAPATDSPPAADDGQTPSKQALPPNWVEFVTAINKKPYFYNKVTKETTWVVPEAVEEPPAAEEPPMPPPPAPIIVSREYLADVSLTVTMPERLLATPIAELAVRALENRSSFLVWLKEEFTELANVQDRQKVANAISKVAKTMELPPPPDDPKDKRLANGTLYTKPEFKGYYGGYQEWYLAPRTTLESSPRDRLFKMLEHGRRDDAHAFLYSRGCGSAKERELVMRRTRPPPRDPNAKTEIAEEPPPPTPEADAVIAAGQVAFITLTTAGYASYTANYLESLRRVDECDVPLTVYCADEASFSRLSASWPAGGAAVGGAAAADAAAADAAATDAPHRTPAAGGAAGGAAAGGATSYARIERVPRSEYEFTPPPRMLQPKTDLVWPQLCVLKCRLISAALARCEYVLFTDSDVVALRPGFVRHVIQLLASSSTALADTRGGAASAGGIELLMQNYARHDVETAAKMALDRGEGRTGSSSPDEARRGAAWRGEARHQECSWGGMRPTLQLRAPVAAVAAANNCG